MVTKKLYLLILLLFTATCLADDSDSITVCPNGHTTIKKIRIIYGHVSMDEELKKKIEQRDVELGGCIIDENSPKYRLYCKTCNLEQIPFNRSHWWLKSKDLKDFINPFTPFIEIMKSGFNYSDIEEYNQIFDNSSLVAEGLRMYMHLPDIDRKYVTQQAFQYCKSKDIVIDESSIEKTRYITHFAGCYKDNLITITISNYTVSNYTVSVVHMLTSFPGAPYMEGCQ